jgi:hypothetical protein
VNIAHVHTRAVLDTYKAAPKQKVGANMKVQQLVLGLLLAPTTTAFLVRQREEMKASDTPALLARSVC